MSDEGKVAMVTGGARGIGLEIVRELLGMGMTVVAADVQGDLLDALPRTGIPGQFQSYQEFHSYVDTLVRTNSISDASRIWYDILPHHRYPTLYVRICDEVPDYRDALAVTALLQAVVAWMVHLRRNNMSFRVYERLLIEDLSFRLPPGGIVGVIGPNGAGKTTLFRMITGQEQPDSGSLRLGDTVRLAWVDQSRDELKADDTVWQAISEGQDTIQLGRHTVNSRGYVASFNFKGADQQKPVRALSGGERNRVHLARTLKSGGNVLLLDEPSNDLDVDTLRALEEALLGFAGCVVVISHDRWFLDRIATHILAFEGDSHVEWFEGNYQDYDADFHKRRGSDADQPHRIKFKKLSA